MSLEFRPEDAMQEAGFCGKTDPEQLTVASAHCMFFFGGRIPPTPKSQIFFGGVLFSGGGVNKKSSKHIQTKNPW